jgi:hypothetical protein
MCERKCNGNNLMISTKTVEELRTILPGLLEVKTEKDFGYTRTYKGTFVYRKGPITKIHMNRPCPHLENGKCTLVECFVRAPTIE